MQLQRQREAQAEERASTLTVGTLPQRVDLVLYQGDDFYMDLTVLGPADLTGYVPKAEIRSAPGGSPLTEFEATIIGTTVVRLHLTSLDATSLPATVSWDVQVTDPAGTVTTLAYGSATVAREVTK
jgi:hypothetical protein